MTDYEVTCILRSDRAAAHEKIKSIGGIDRGDGKRWKLTQLEAIHAIQSAKARFYVTVGGKAVPVIIGTSSWGEKYLKSASDREQPQTLLNLPECPYF